MDKETDLDTFSIQETAVELGLSVSKVRRLIEERALIALQKGGQERIPRGLIVNGQVISSLRGTLILLSDLGLNDAEALEWLTQENDDLGRTPLESLTMGHKAPVRRAAQLLAESF